MNIGYIINCEMDGGGAVVLVTKSRFWKDLPPGGALFAATRTATVFASRAVARAAICRTMDYWHKVHNRHHDWPDDAYSVHRLVPTETDTEIDGGAPSPDPAGLGPINEAFSRGVDARLQGVDETKNPYRVTSDEYLSWNDGWLNARDWE